MIWKAIGSHHTYLLEEESAKMKMMFEEHTGDILGMTWRWRDGREAE